MKTHLSWNGGDYRSWGQTQHEYTHQTACGYVRDSITRDKSKVTCKLCLRAIAEKEVDRGN